MIPAGDCTEERFAWLAGHYYTWDEVLLIAEEATEAECARISSLGYDGMDCEDWHAGWLAEERPWEPRTSWWVDVFTVVDGALQRQEQIFFVSVDEALSYARPRAKHISGDRCFSDGKGRCYTLHGCRLPASWSRFAA